MFHLYRWDLQGFAEVDHADHRSHNRPIAKKQKERHLTYFPFQRTPTEQPILEEEEVALAHVTAADGVYKQDGLGQWSPLASQHPQLLLLQHALHSGKSSFMYLD
ncbi:hypothetical protein CDAR_372191 [Caerostris darwini]|uniref:Uncharacterized protein n=1 Tax=Caerostris darwini TaxID=1538125 RepID=A0AAV4W106_9ARAC|nr:hypothetical protein CDAR_372191 [Caerostris darwini]